MTAFELATLREYRHGRLVYSIIFHLQIRVVAYRVTDNDERATTTVRVNVIRNSSPPRFLHQSIIYTISESYPVGTLFGDVNATDPDSVSCWFFCIIFEHGRLISLQ